MNWEAEAGGDETLARWRPLVVDVRGRSTTFASSRTDLVRSVLEQDGVRISKADRLVPISVSASDLTPSWVCDDTASWLSSSTTVTRHDFRASGGALHFGYQYGSRAVCTGVGLRTAVAKRTRVDNGVVDVNRRASPPGTVPESGAMLLAAAALVLLRRQKTKSPGL
jgi:hypothetical protein